MSEIGRAAEIEWDEHGSPRSCEYRDIYFMQQQGLAESRYVFLEQNQLPQRFQALQTQQHFTIGETGFGTGLNFLACWQLWQQNAPKNAKLHYISVEKHPLKPEDLIRCIQLHPELSTLGKQLVNQYQLSFSGCAAPKLQHYYWDNVRLLLIVDEAEAGLQSLLASTHPDFAQPQWQCVDAWFLDGFAPAINPQMWTRDLFLSLGTLSKPGATLASFTAASKVRHQLSDCGFLTSKVKGFGRKREMLKGEFIGSTNNLKFNKTKTPWNVVRDYKPLSINRPIAVIGAGIAGCNTAYALAKRGYKVTLIEQHQDLATQASGNPQGIVYAKLSPHSGSLGDFNLSALLYAQQLYHEFWQGCPMNGTACGVLQLAHQKKERNYLDAVTKRFSVASFVKMVSPHEASDIAGIPLTVPALYFPHCGWLSPKALCRWLTQHSAINIVRGQVIHRLIKGSDSWRLEGFDQHFGAVILCNANDAQAFTQTNWLPVKTIRGQISYLQQTGIPEIKSVICGEGYIAPSIKNSDLGHMYTLGASYNLRELDLAISEQDHHKNIAQIGDFFPEVHHSKILSGRAGIRCTSPDYLPIVGPVPQQSSFKSDYHYLSKNARKTIDTAGKYWPGLYVNIAHGSKGLAYTPLAAALIASHVAGEAPPVCQAMADTLNPARFLIRQLIRGEILDPKK